MEGKVVWNQEYKQFPRTEAGTGETSLGGKEVEKKQKNLDSLNFTEMTQDTAKIMKRFDKEWEENFQ